MIIVIVRHMLQPGMYEAARERLAAKLVTVTGWASEDDRAAWEAARKAAPPPGNMAGYYSDLEIMHICVFDRRNASVGALEP